MGVLGGILGMICLGGLIYLIGKAISNGPVNNPTWEGIIISALIGMLPLYLILCFLGYMGEERDNRL